MSRRDIQLQPGWQVVHMGAPKPPAEVLANAQVPGLAAGRGDSEEKVDRKRQANRDERIAKSRRWAADREELASLRDERSKGDSR